LLTFTPVSSEAFGDLSYGSGVERGVRLASFTIWLSCFIGVLKRFQIQHRQTQGMCAAWIALFSLSVTWGGGGTHRHTKMTTSFCPEYPDNNIPCYEIAKYDASFSAASYRRPTHFPSTTSMGFCLSPASRYVIARVYGLTNVEQKHYTTQVHW